MPRVPLLAVAIAGLAACGARDEHAESLTGGDVTRGRIAIRQYACQTCHVIPGVTGADAIVGPPLNGIGRRRYLAGVLPNSPESMVLWIRAPRTVEPLTAMPDLGVTERDARDIAAYLYTLR